MGRPVSEQERFLGAIRRIARELREASREVEARLGLSAAQLFVLHQLRDGGACTIGVLAARTFTHQSSVSVVVARLAQLGLVERRPGQDRRQVLVSLAPSAQELLARSPEPVQQRLLTALAGLAPADRATLVELLEQFSLRLNPAEPPMLFEEERPPRS